MVNIQHKLRALGQRLGIRMPKQTHTLLGKPFLVHAATLRKEPDYDDAWLLACANHAELVVDVGSNIGQAAFIILLSQKIKRLILIEANPRALVFAADNLITNHLSARVSFVCFCK